MSLTASFAGESGATALTLANGSDGCCSCEVLGWVVVLVLDVRSELGLLSRCSPRIACSISFINCLWSFVSSIGAGSSISIIRKRFSESTCHLVGHTYQWLYVAPFWPPQRRYHYEETLHDPPGADPFRLLAIHSVNQCVTHGLACLSHALTYCSKIRLQFSNLSFNAVFFGHQSLCVFHCWRRLCHVCYLKSHASKLDSKCGCWVEYVFASAKKL